MGIASVPPQFLDDLICAGTEIVIGIYDERDASQRQNDLGEPETGFTVQLNLVFHDILLAKEKTQPRCAAGLNRWVALLRHCQIEVE